MNRLMKKKEETSEPGPIEKLEPIDREDIQIKGMQTMSEDFDVEARCYTEYQPVVMDWSLRLGYEVLTLYSAT